VPVGLVLQLMNGMKKQFAYAIIGLVATALTACGNKTSTASDNSTAAVTLPTALSVYAASSMVALGATTTISVSGGSGTYVTATATLGTLVATGASTFTYTAPSSASTYYETITITDSNGLSGSTQLTLSGASGGGTSTTGTTSCSGTYSVNLGGVAASMVLVGGANGYVAGYLDMWSYKYPVYGSCSISGASGTITLTEPSVSSTFSGSVSFNGSTITMSGSASNQTGSGGAAAWTATSQTAAVTVSAPTSNSCQGTYTATVGPNPGQILFVQDGNNKIAGVMQLNVGTQIFYYSLSGTCSGGSINFTNITTGSPYSGTVSFTSSGASMSGTYSANSTTYNWSATR
jgi:hypothetical protein